MAYPVSPIVFPTRSNGQGIQDEWFNDLQTEVAALTGEGAGAGIYNVKSYGGALGNGTADDTTAIATTITAAGVSGGTVFFPPGAYIVSALTGLSNVIFQGCGRGISTIKRKANAVSTAAILDFTGKFNFAIRDLTLDGNKANQTVTSYGNVIIATGSYEWMVERVETINCKTGVGILVSDGANDTNIEPSKILNCRCVGNDSDAIYVTKEHYIEIRGNFCKSNGGGGINIFYFVFPPVEGSQSYLTIKDNNCHSNAASGIGVGGFYTGGTAEAPFFEAITPVTKFIHVVNNHCNLNGTYGIAFQGGQGVVSGNILCKNGNAVTPSAGALFNSYASDFTHNVMIDNYSYGVDAGGSFGCNVSNNICQNNGLTAVAASTDINIGGARHCRVSNNNIQQGGNVHRVGIQADALEGTGTVPFAFRGTDLVIDGNSIRSNGFSTSTGVYVTRQFDKVTVRNNYCSNFAADNLAYRLEVTGLVESNNLDDRVYAGGSPVQSVVAASTMVIPDVGEKFFVSGTTTIARIHTYSADNYYQKVRTGQMSDFGTGYDPLSPPAVSFSGGGGSGAAANALVSNEGYVVGVMMTDFGTGYTSAPGMLFAAPVSGVTATGIALVGCDNFAGREISLMFTGALTVGDLTGNCDLAGNLVTTGNKNLLRLRGAYGNWYEVTRSTL